MGLLIDVMTGMADPSYSSRDLFDDIRASEMRDTIRQESQATRDTLERIEFNRSQDNSIFYNPASYNYNPMTYDYGHRDIPQTEGGSIFQVVLIMIAIIVGVCWGLPLLLRL